MTSAEASHPGCTCIVKIIGSTRLDMFSHIAVNRRGSAATTNQLLSGITM